MRKHSRGGSWVWERRSFDEGRNGPLTGAGHDGLRKHQDHRFWEHL